MTSSSPTRAANDRNRRQDRKLRPAARMLRLRHRAVQRDPAASRAMPGAARKPKRWRSSNANTPITSPYMTPRKASKPSNGRIHGRGRRRRPDHAAGERCRMRLYLHGKTASSEKAWMGGGRTPFRKPIRAISIDPRDALLERHRGTQLPPLVGVRSGPPVRREACIPVYRPFGSRSSAAFGEEFFKATPAAEELIRQQ